MFNALGNIQDLSYEIDLCAVNRKVYIHLGPDVYTVINVGKRGLYVRIDEELLRRFAEKARRLGMTTSEALRRAMESFATPHGPSMTSRMRGLVKSRLSYEELEEAYSVFKG